VLAMTELWRIEDEVRGKDADSRAARHQEKSSTTVASLFELWEKELGKVSGKSKTAEAIRYALTRREALERFLTDGRIEIDSNIVERAIRPQTITRKNSLFAGSEGGGRTWATVATLLQTCLCRARHNAVYADRRTMPSTCSNIPFETRFSRRFRWRFVVGTRHSSHAQRAFRNSRSRSLGRNRSALARSYGFSFASADSFSSRCA
ncbi:transposase, partial [Sinorhizobium medicae]|nr:transposase [Sinorhizobium medicae]